MTEMKSCDGNAIALSCQCKCIAVRRFHHAANLEGLWAFNANSQLIYLQKLIKDRLRACGSIHNKWVLLGVLLGLCCAPIPLNAHPRPNWTAIPEQTGHPKASEVCGITTMPPFHSTGGRQGQLKDIYATYQRSSEAPLKTANATPNWVAFFTHRLGFMQVGEACCELR